MIANGKTRRFRGKNGKRRVNSRVYPLSIKIKLLFALALPFSVLGVVFYMLRAPILDWRPFKKKESVHGDARWATEKEIRKIGLRSRKGLLLGKDKRGF